MVLSEAPEAPACSIPVDLNHFLSQIFFVRPSGTPFQSEKDISFSLR